MVDEAACGKYQGLGHASASTGWEERHIQRNRTFPNFIVISTEMTTWKSQKKMGNPYFPVEKKIH